MEEDYVNFETAKHLKEKGFHVPIHTFYNPNKKNYGVKLDPCLIDRNAGVCVSAPTLQMAMKWLRKIHNLHIEVFRTACGYLYVISDVPSGTDLYGNVDANDGDDKSSGQWTTYEKACESAIKYCLENLI